MNDLLKELNKNPDFQAVMDEALNRRPIVSPFSMADTQDEQYMVVERIKYSTAMRQGFDILYQYLTGRKPAP